MGLVQSKLRFPRFGFANVFTAPSLSATGDKLHLVGQVKWSDLGTHDLHSIEFSLGTVTKVGGSTLGAAVQLVGTGNPGRGDGSDIKAGTVANASIVAANNWQVVTLATDLTALPTGAIRAIVIRFDSYGGSDAIQTRHLRTPGTSGNEMGVVGYGVLNTTAQTLVPNILLRSLDGAVGTLVGGVVASAQAFTTGFNSGSNPEEQGNQWTAPEDCIVSGAEYTIQLTDVSSDHQLVMYDNATPPNVLATATIPGTATQQIGAQMSSIVYFDTVTTPVNGGVQVTNGTVYNFMIKATAVSAHNLIIGTISVNAAGDMKAWPQQDSLQFITKHSTTIAAPTTTKIALLFPIVDRVGQSASSGGGIVGGRMGLGR